jgi:hypothetical protein
MSKDKISGADAIARLDIKTQFSTFPKRKCQLLLYAMYLLTRDAGYYPADWAKDDYLIALVDTLPIIERTAYVGALMALEYERLRDNGGFAMPKHGL